MNIIIQLLLLAGGFFLLVKGADWFVDGASGIASKLGVSQLIIGLTIVAMGTSLPEAAVSITAAAAGSEGITIGNIIGSNTMNILVILGAASLIASIPVGTSTVRREIPFMLLCSVVFVLLGRDGMIGRLDGGIFWILFLIYLGYLFMEARAGQEEDENADRLTWPRAILMVAGGLFCIIFGSDIAVDAACSIARIAGLSEEFIGLTIVALGTSLPELVTSVTAAAKGDTDIAIGNIVGSNIFNILFVVGTSSLLIPVPFSDGFQQDIIIMLAAGLLLWFFCIKDKKLGRLSGVIMLGCYILNFGFMVFQ